jgi:predicted Zn-ribbon and HTH transcriptional regulator
VTPVTDSIAVSEYCFGLGSSHQEENMSSHLYKNDRADPKLPGYILLIAPTNCKDCDCAQRLVRCQNAVEQHRTIFV